MEQYIINKTQHTDVEHILLKLNTKLGISIITMSDLEGESYNIAPIEFTGMDDEYELINQFNFVTREYKKVEEFVNNFTKINN